MHRPDPVDDVATEGAPGGRVVVHFLLVLKAATVEHVATRRHHGGEVHHGVGAAEWDPAEDTDCLGKEAFPGEDGGVRPQVDGGGAGETLV